MEQHEVSMKLWRSHLVVVNSNEQQHARFLKYVRAKVTADGGKLK